MVGKEQIKNYVDYYTGVMMEMKKMMMRDCDYGENKGIGDAGSTADIGTLWSAIVCLGLLKSALNLVC